MQPQDQPREPYAPGGVPPAPDPAGRSRHGHGPLGDTGAEPPTAPPSVPGAPPPTAAPAPPPQRIKRTLTSSLWIGLIIGVILLILLIVFIAENSRTVTIDLIFGDTRTSLALGLLLSAVIGALLVAIPGTIRIFQLRKEVKRRMR